MNRAVLLLLLALLACDRAVPTQAVNDAPRLDAQENDDDNRGSVLRARLSPRNEVPPGTGRARGTARLRFTDENMVHFRIVVSNPERETFVAGHIHRGPRGVNGPVVVDLLGGLTPRSARHIVFRGSKPVAAALAAEIRNNPEGFYVNLHTTQRPGGTTRGQLRGGENDDD